MVTVTVLMMPVPVEMIRLSWPVFGDVNVDGAVTEMFQVVASSRSAMA